eukprot:symbB.v1.2.001504.t1/scaffold82.1/size400680/14
MTSGLLLRSFTPPIQLASDDCLRRACLASTKCRPFFNSVQGWWSLCLGLSCGSKIALSPIQAFRNLHTPPASSSKLLQTVGLLMRFYSRRLPWNLHDEPFDLIGYLAVLDLPETFTRAWVAVNSGTHAAAELVALAAGVGLRQTALRLRLGVNFTPNAPGDPNSKWEPALTTGYNWSSCHFYGGRAISARVTGAADGTHQPSGAQAPASATAATGPTPSEAAFDPWEQAARSREDEWRPSWSGDHYSDWWGSWSWHSPWSWQDRSWRSGNSWHDAPPPKPDYSDPPGWKA